MKAHEKILRARGHAPESADNVYKAFVDSDGHPQASFVLFTRDEMHLFQYSHFDNAHWLTRNGKDYLYFTHRGKAVTLRGERLGEIMLAFREYRVQSLHEFDGTQGRYENDPLIERVHIVDMNAAPNLDDLAE